ncbi:aldehyde dehydrogenase [Thozetella sp. PMI_491]|nr:aldehyde dehydrogenase [Thozetella sp. PMI_491]
MALEIDPTSKLEVVPLWIDGASATASPAQTFPVHSAAKGQDVYLAQGADVDAAKKAADAAWAAFQTWRKEGPIQRRDMLLRVATILTQGKEELKQIQMDETSCTKEWAEMNVNLAIETIREFASRITSVSGQIPQMANPEHMALVFKEPIGPILTIAPWNAAVILASRAITAPIAMGCTVVFKASELCPRTHHFLAQAWTEAGLPKGVLNVIQARREDSPAVTEALIAHPSIRKIEFIGSRAVGNIIGQVAAKYTKPIFMELGGKSAAIVLDDARLEQAAHLCLMGAFLHHGQICFSTERILVQESIAPKFIEVLKGKAAEFSSAGYAVNLRMAQTANSRIVEAHQKGAEFLIGKLDLQDDSLSLVPTILTSVTPDMQIFDEETFGPSASLYIFKDDKAAIDMTNASAYGLNAAIHTTNMERGIEIARALEVGQVHINNLTEYDEATLPVGGEKASGWGRSNAHWGFEEYLTLKTITINMKQPQTYI